MKKYLIFCLITVLASGCATTKSRKAEIPLEQRDDALGILAQLRATESTSQTRSPGKIADSIRQSLDSLNAENIRVTPAPYVPFFLDDIDRATKSDSILFEYAQTNNNYLLQINLIEFKFRTIVEAQRELKHVFNNESPAKNSQTGDSTTWNQQAFEYHGAYGFQQQVSFTLPYIQANERYSGQKTKLLVNLLEMKPLLANPNIQQRWWLAIDRMLENIDIRKSESGYRAFQRTHEGIFAKNKRIMVRLREFAAGETAADVKAYANEVTSKLNKRYTRIDKSFEQEVLNNQKMRRQFHEDVLKNATPKISAREYVDNGMMTDDPQTKVKQFTAALDIDPDYIVAYHNRGTAYQSLNQPANAIRDFSSAINLDPNFAPAYVNRGKIYQQQGKFSEAIRDLSTAIALEPDYIVAYDARGRCHYNQAHYEAALRDFNHVLKLDSSFATAYSNRGDVYRQLEQYENAIREYNKAIQLDSNYASAFNNRGLCYSRIKQYREAIKDYNKAIELQPDFAPAYYNLGRVYWEKQHWSRVITIWEKCLELDPEHEKAQRYLPEAKKQAQFEEWRKIRR